MTGSVSLIRSSGHRTFFRLVLVDLALEEESSFVAGFGCGPDLYRSALGGINTEDWDPFRRFSAQQRKYASQ
jgi:hypothetical protein